MNKVKFFYDEHQYGLEKKVNEFIRGRNVINISYSTHMIGYSLHHYCVVMYQDW